jgi:hypothetical protein
MLLAVIFHYIFAATDFQSLLYGLQSLHVHKFCRSHDYMAALLQVVIAIVHANHST